MFAFDQVAYLVDGSHCLPWSFEGYGLPVDFDPGTVVAVLTPRSLLATLRQGYRPQIHMSAAGHRPA